jgi:hypothetical protein
MLWALSLGGRQMDQAIQEAIRRIANDPFLTDGQKSTIIKHLRDLLTLLGQNPLDPRRIWFALQVLLSYARLVHADAARYIWVVIRGTGAMAFAGEAGAGAGAGGAAAGGASAGTVAAPLAVILLSLGWISWNLWRRFSGPSDTGEGGVPCGRGTPAGESMSVKKRTVRAQTILGAMVSWDMALQAAQEACAADSANCGGDCPEGKTCKPNVAVQDWDQYWQWFPPGKVTELVVTCPCECL